MQKCTTNVSPCGHGTYVLMLSLRWCQIEVLVPYAWTFITDVYSWVWIALTHAVHYVYVSSWFKEQMSYSKVLKFGTFIFTVTIEWADGEAEEHCKWFCRSRFSTNVLNISFSWEWLSGSVGLEFYPLPEAQPENGVRTLHWRTDSLTTSVCW